MNLHVFINLFMNQYIYIFIYLLIYSLFLYFLKNSIKKKSLLSLIELYFYFFISSFIDQLFLFIFKLLGIFLLRYNLKRTVYDSESRRFSLCCCDKTGLNYI